MALSGIINTALSGLFTNQASLRVVANNVANVNNEDYARLRAQQESVTFLDGPGGVRLAGVERVVDEFLQQATRTALANTGEFTAQRELHDRLQGVFGNPNSPGSLPNRLDEVYASVAELAIAPGDNLRRQDFISELNNFLGVIDRYQNEIQSLRASASQQIAESVQQANNLLRQIGELNPLLVRATAQVGQEGVGALQSQMDAAIDELSDIIDISVDRQADGSFVVRTGSGQPLVDSSLTQFSYETPGSASAETLFPPIELSRIDPDTGQPFGTPVDMANHIRSGRLLGLVEMRDNQLVDAANSLGELAAHVKDEFNRIHNSFSSVPAPSELTGEPTIVDGAHETGFTGIVRFSALGADNEVVATSTFDFDADPTMTFDDMIAQVNADLGGEAVLALNNGVLTFTGQNGNGVAVTDDPAAPTDRGGRGFSHFFGLNNLVESAGDGVYQTGVSGTDTHGLSGGSIIFSVTDSNNRHLARISVPATGTDFDDMLAELNDPTGLGAYFTFALDGNGKITYSPTGRDVTLSVVGDDTDVNGSGIPFSRAFGLGDNVQAITARGIRVKEEFTVNPERLSLSQYEYNVGVGSVAITNGDQRGALALQSLQTLQVQFAEAGGVGASKSTLNQYTARWVGQQGLLARQATNLEEDNLALQQELEARKADYSAVNMDEELANLVAYQNAYNASARILSSVQELYDTLLTLV